jgi:FG-GAP-like repeat
MKEETQPSQGNAGNHEEGVFPSARKWAWVVKSGIETALCRKITGTDWKKVLANRWNSKKIPKQAHAGWGARSQMGNPGLGRRPLFQSVFCPLVFCVFLQTLAMTALAGSPPSMSGYDTNYNPHTWLFHNNHDGTFTEVATPFPNVSGSSADWADFDGDGYLDLVIASSGIIGTSAQVYRNLGGTNFALVANLSPVHQRRFGHLVRSGQRRQARHRSFRRKRNDDFSQQWRR